MGSEKQKQTGKAKKEEEDSAPPSLTASDNDDDVSPPAVTIAKPRGVKRQRRAGSVPSSPKTSTTEEDDHDDDNKDYDALSTPTKSQQQHRRTPSAKRNRGEESTTAAATPPPADPPSPSRRLSIAAVVGILSDVSAGVHAALTRMGVPGCDRTVRWDAFLEQRVASQMREYLAATEAEERSMAAENDQLLRDVFYLCQRLEEPCRDPALNEVVRVMAEVTTTQKKKMNVNDDTNGKGHGNEDEDDGAEMDDMMIMPSFTSFFLLERPSSQQQTVAAVAAAAATSPSRESGAVTTATATTNEQEEGAAVKKRRARSDAAAAAIRSATAHLSQQRTHREVRSLLKAEEARLDGVATHRLRLLCLLQEQRVVLSRPASEQARLHAAHAAKYLGTGTGSGGDGLLEMLSLPPSCTATDNNERDEGQSRDSVASSSNRRSYHSALSSAKLSPRSSAHRQSNNNTTNGSGGNERHVAAVAEGVHRSNNSNSHHGNTPQDEELNLFLQACLVGDSMDLRGTSFCLQPRPTAAAATTTPVSIAAVTPPQQQLDRGGNTTTASNDSSNSSSNMTKMIKKDDAAAVTDGHDDTSDGSGRVTLFTVDVSDVLQYGKRQDLSTARIRREAGEILALIAERNAAMEQDTAEELEYLRSLLQSNDNNSTNEGSKGSDDEDEENKQNQKSMTARVKVDLPLTMAGIESRVRELRATFEQEASAAATVDLDGGSNKDDNGGYGGTQEGNEEEEVEEFIGSQRPSRSHVQYPTSSSTSGSGAPGPSSSRATRLTAAFHGSSSSSSGGVGSVITETTVLRLPLEVRRLLAATSLAPLLHFVQSARQACQARVWAAHLSAVRSAATDLSQAQAACAVKQRSDSPSSISINSKSISHMATCGGDSGGPVAAAAAACAAWLAEHGSFELSLPPAAPLARTAADLDRRAATARALLASVDGVLAVLREKLSIVAATEPLLATRQAILTEQRDMLEGRRELLLSKKANSAKERLNDEAVRRRIARELPKIISWLGVLADQWDKLAASTNDNNSDSCGGGAFSTLRVHGQSVRDIVRQFREGGAGSGATTTAAAAASTFSSRRSGTGRSGPTSAASSRLASQRSVSLTRGATPPPQATSTSRPRPPNSNANTSSSLPCSQQQQQQQQQASHSGRLPPLSQRSAHSAGLLRSRSVSPTPVKPPTAAARLALIGGGATSRSSSNSRATPATSVAMQRRGLVRPPLSSLSLRRRVAASSVPPGTTVASSSSASSASASALAASHSVPRSRVWPASLPSLCSAPSSIPRAGVTKTATAAVLFKSRNPVAQVAQKRAAQSSLAARAGGGVFSRLAAARTDDKSNRLQRPEQRAAAPTVHGNNDNNDRTETSQAKAGGVARPGGGLQTRSASLANGKPSAFTGPSKYQPATTTTATHVTGSGACDTADSQNQSPSRSQHQQPHQGKRTVAEIDMSPMCSQAPVGSGSSSPLGFVATSLSRELEDAATSD